jgi:hypothetical protein
VFNYKGTPLKHLKVTIDRGQLKQTGTLHKVIDLPFTIRAALSATPSARNYMYYRGRILRFGKLTMVDADLQIVDGDPSVPFDFYLAHLNEQFVAGVSRNQADFGLLTVMPDYADLERRTSAGAKAR